MRSAWLSQATSRYTTTYCMLAYSMLHAYGTVDVPLRIVAMCNTVPSSWHPELYTFAPFATWAPILRKTVENSAQHGAPCGTMRHDGPPCGTVEPAPQRRERRAGRRSRKWFRRCRSSSRFQAGRGALCRRIRWAGCSRHYEWSPADDTRRISRPCVGELDYPHVVHGGRA